MDGALDEMIPAWVEGRLAPVGKLEVHQLGLRHKAVSVFVMEGARVLIQKRAAGKYHTPGLWANTCCTHPRWNEDAATCAVRRLREELGITGLYPHYAGRVEYRAEVGGGLIEHELVDIFVAEAAPGLIVVPALSEVEDVRWVDLYDLKAEVLRQPERFTPWLRIYLTDHMDRIFGARMMGTR
ncbi:isopentenyl-diphosphate delta-isomerase [Tabrizicola caldifontis]|uniref:isopentenyl-diphosphate delta-isomerase n=1 Tax=Tabrizicola caldifontis TaxID=2528036 RepID=UPI00107FF334|nr:isopentenyl-diphosphate delta-isomerase [Rhodobacter sp. YIM 73028]